MLKTHRQPTATAKLQPSLGSRNRPTLQCSKQPFLVLRFLLNSRSAVNVFLAFSAGPNSRSLSQAVFSPKHYQKWQVVVPVPGQHHHLPPPPRKRVSFYKFSVSPGEEGFRKHTFSLLGAFKALQILFLKQPEQMHPSSAVLCSEKGREREIIIIGEGCFAFTHTPISPSQAHISALLATDLATGLLLLLLRNYANGKFLGFL